MHLLVIWTRKGGYRGAPKFPTFNLFSTFIFYNSTKKEYLKPDELIIKQLCSKEFTIMWKEGYQDILLMTLGLFSLRKKLYDNVQFILLLSKYCKLNDKNILKKN